MLPRSLVIVAVSFGALGSSTALRAEDSLPAIRETETLEFPVTLPWSVERGSLLVVDVEVPSDACQHLFLFWEGRRYLGHAAGPVTRFLAPVGVDAPRGRRTVFVDCDGRRGMVPVRVESLVPRISDIQPLERPRMIAKTGARRFGEPPKWRVLRELRAVGQALREAGGPRRWTQQFLRPADGIDTSAFGSTRVFRGRRSVHEGVDIAGGASDAVYAANDGRVLLVADDFFFLGNAVILDHGEGLLTLYMHLADVSVRRGQRLRRGDRLGTIGATGRVTGKHLHFAVRFKGEYIDPNDLLAFVPGSPLPQALTGAVITPDRFAPIVAKRN